MECASFVKWLLAISICILPFKRFMCSEAGKIAIHCKLSVTV